MSEFKIAAAQVASVRGEYIRNIVTHTSAIAAAAAHGVRVLVFPELSLTGYEPEVASAQPIAISDKRLDPLSDLAQRQQMYLSVGAPLALGGPRPALGAILFAPDGSRFAYAKMHLGGSESHYFAPGDKPLSFAVDENRIGMCICADAAVPAHPHAYAKLGVNIYAAGVFLNAEWYATDAPRLAAYAPAHRMLVVMANHAASIGTYTSVGRSSIWSPDGTLLAQAQGTENSLVIATRSANEWQAAVVAISGG